MPISAHFSVQDCCSAEWYHPGVWAREISIKNKLVVTSFMFEENYWVVGTAGWEVGLEYVCDRVAIESRF